MRSPLRAAVLTSLGTLLAAAPPPAPDLAKERTLFVVNYSHLDTQWRWAYPLVVRRMLRDTLYDNFAIMEQHPEYVFNWTGAGRYQMFEEYYPAEFARLKGYAAKGQWWPSSNAWEECDVNVPSSESILRQLLVGNQYFRRHFGTESLDFMLPDCFGFPASLPSILAHAGLQGFSTQKLTWGSAAGVPFNVGRWTGPDGKGIVAAFNPGAYDALIKESLHSPAWVKRLDANGEKLGIKADMLYNGIGDEGGAPLPESMATVWASMAGKGPVNIVMGRADQLFTSITGAQRAALPEYKGDLLLTEHSAGSITSQAFLKRLNRQDELLADAAEKAGAAASLLGACPWPKETLDKAWGLMLRNQFHDILPGTCLPKSYEYAWNDGIIAARAFEGALLDGAAGVARALDTRVEGTPLVVFNPLGVDREDVVEALVPAGLEKGDLEAVDGAGKAAPAQRTLGVDGRQRVIFIAKVPAVGFAVYGLRPGKAAAGTLKVQAGSLENGRYRAALDASGDLASLYDKQLKRELLSAPARLDIQEEKPNRWPAWNMDWKDRQKAPRAHVGGAAQVRIVEQGPVRVAVEVARETEGSRFVQVYRLSAGDAGNRLEVASVVDWKTSQASLKASFPLASSNPVATYNWDLGTIQRGNNDPKKYEVPTHGWMDLTDPAGAYGVTVLTGAKVGTDKPADGTLRLTLLYTPGVNRDYREQRWQDWGRHAFTYGLAGHAGDWRKGQATWQAQRQDQPLTAFQVEAHAGPLGKRFSLLRVSSPQVAIQAIKRAESGEGYVVRLQELEGRPAQGLKLQAAGAIEAAEELDGLEHRLGALAPAKGTLALDFTPYQMRTLGLRLAPPATVPAPAGTPLDLPFDVQAFSPNDDRASGAFDGPFTTLPAEMMGDRVAAGGVTFRMGSRARGARNALACAGQVLALPAGTTRVHLLVAATGGDVKTAFDGGRPVTLTIPNWLGYLGSWDNRIFKGEVPDLTYSVDNDLERIAPAFLREGRPAWWASHHHAKGQDAIYEYGCLYAVTVPVTPGAAHLRLPLDARVKVFAATATAVDNAGAAALTPLLPDLTRDAAFTARYSKP
ncbi:MAG TPA: glycoside hydrolase family 38 C-terminal domain-containing protein [Holophaga sp.]|nr:glycoside hydrolase family 38 C-terminal domain-containing protein [Holophaga sp.]